MNSYITGNMIKQLREKKGMTQQELADLIFVSNKAISKWETGRGYPDISLLENLAKALDVSISELLSGDSVINTNISANMLKTNFYVCPVCGNVITAIGEANITCHGINLIKEEVEDNENLDCVKIEFVENEYFVSIDHPMTKENYISFMSVVSFDNIQFVKLYPEGEASARFNLRGARYFYYFDNKNGLSRINLKMLNK